MKVIDKTQVQNEKGEIGFVQRMQGMLEHGKNWLPELEAQKTIVTQLDRVLEKGFTLIRNLQLEKSQITEPLILIGPPGVYVIYVTPLSGFYEAKGDQWNVVKNGHSSPAPKNALTWSARLARALQVYLERQGVTLPGIVEPIVMASDPRMHIDSLRPLVRVVNSDAIKQFGVSLLQARPLLKPESVFDISERLTTPRAKGVAAEPAPQEAAPEPAPVEEASQPSRARAIFHAAEQSKPFDPADLSFAFDETAENAEGGVPQNLRESSPSQRLPKPARPGALKPGQLILLGIMALVECCVIGGFAYFILRSR